MSLSVYVHIPYCLQRCRYCDFTTFEINSIAPPEQYVAQVRQEIRQRAPLLPSNEIHSIYFGGGTPSLLPAELILSLLGELANCGFSWTSEAEVTVEINPATLDEAKIGSLIQGGVNRFSVGAQTFDDELLRLCGRRHSAEETRQTLLLLQKARVNYSFDLLFALPGQTLAGLKSDLLEVAVFDPPHISAYCLTVPETHPMALGRPPEGEQIAMFELIEETLRQMGTLKYEISNFAKPGFESNHNLAYWSDRAYWGVGLSAHSYLPGSGFGMRFWNPKTFDLYNEQISQTRFESFEKSLPTEQLEQLQAHESLTDFCHMFLRTRRGLDLAAVRHKFGVPIAGLVENRVHKLRIEGFLTLREGRWSLTQEGELLSNQVFAELLFCAEDLAAAADQNRPLPFVASMT